MAKEYVPVLQHLNSQFVVVGRGEVSAVSFEKETGVKAIPGGIESFLENNDANEFDSAIVAVGTEMLMAVMLKLLEYGITKILIEKPAAVSIGELEDNYQKLKPFAESIFVAYNRRFYASVAEAKELIRQDGGLKTMHFEFTEWLHSIEPLKKGPGVKENWFFANSTHVVDLAFCLAGKPKNWCAYYGTGHNNWHPKTNFTGAGITEHNILFSYCSNWESAGRWAIELMTDKRRIYLKPMEKVHVQMKGSIAIDEHACYLEIDEKFKPGLLKQTEAFIKNNHTLLLNLEGHKEQSSQIFNKILNGNHSDR